MTKKQIKAKNSQYRVRALFNTGTRTFKSAKDYKFRPRTVKSGRTY